MRWATPLERFQGRVVQDENACWMWTGATRPNGYGTFRADGFCSSHRWSYAYFVGPIPDGYEVDHLCKSRACCNPEHLEAITMEENRRRQKESKTHCAQGHEFSPDNTTYWTDTEGYKIRRCIACSRASSLRQYAKDPARYAAEARRRRAVRAQERVSRSAPPQPQSAGW